MRSRLDERREAHPVPWGPKDVLSGLALAGLGLALAIGGTALALVALNLPSDEEAGDLALLAATLAFEATLVAVALAIALGKHGSRLSDLGFRPLRREKWWIPPASVGAIFMVLLIYGIIVRLLGIERAQPQSTLPERLFDRTSTLALAGGLAVIIAPLAEETFFRGFIFTALHQRWGFLRAAATSGFLFALPHADPGSIIPFTGAGMVLAVAYANSGSLWGSIATHALFNLISFTAAATTGIGGGG